MKTTEPHSAFPTNRIQPFSGNKQKSIYAPRDIDELTISVSALRNMEVKWSTRNELVVSGHRATLYLCLPPQPTGETVKAHPFQIYELDHNQISASDKATYPSYKYYAVRSGYVEYRLRWKDISSYPQPTKTPDYSYYVDDFGGGTVFASGGLTFGDDVEQVSGTGKLGFQGGYFGLNPTAEIGSGSLNLGSYYAFYISIQDMLPNTLPTCQILARRFSPNGAGLDYPKQAFPDPSDDEEIFQIGIVQVTPSTGYDPEIPPNLGTGIIGTPPINSRYISQILRTNIINRYDRLGLRDCGDFNIAQYRTYYPGDLVFWDAAGDTANAKYGWWKCYAQSTNGAAVTNPDDVSFEYFANPNPPSATNPP